MTHLERVAMSVSAQALPVFSYFAVFWEFWRYIASSQGVRAGLTPDQVPERKHPVYIQ